MARIELPDLEEIPGPEVDRTKGEDAEPLVRWRVPRTEITLVRVEEGPRTGDYLFSADTVARALSFYQAVKDLPYRQPMPLENLYLSLETATGWMIPPAWVDALPDWANFRILDQVLWKWIVLLLLVAVSVIAGVAVFRWSRGRARDGSLGSFLTRLSTRFDEDQSGGWRPVGTVEAIGLRSVKIRKFDRSLITIPNAEFAQRNIVNLSTCDRFLLTATIGLRYETTDDQLRFVLAAETDGRFFRAAM